MDGVIETAEMPPLARSVALLAELEGVATGADLAMAGAVCDVIDAAMPATWKLRERVTADVRAALVPFGEG